MPEKVIEIRPARIQARYIDPGDMLVSSPHSRDGNHERPSYWIGRVDQQIDPADPDGLMILNPDEYRQWRIAMVDGTFTESAAIPADGFVWVHLPNPSELVP